MRKIEIEGPRARIERLKLLDAAEEYGLELAPESTAPFTVRWVETEYEKYAGVFLKSTFIGKVDMTNKKPMLLIRKEYPAQHDNALLRALRNAADLTDMIGKMQREETRNETIPDPSGVLSKDKIAYDFHITDAETLNKALLGVEALHPNITFSWQKGVPNKIHPYFSVRVHLGKAEHGFKIEHREDRMVVCFSDYDRYGVKSEMFKEIVDAGLAAYDEPHGVQEEALNALLDEGLKVFNERFIPETFMTACRTLIAHTPLIDAESLMGDYTARDPQTLRAVKTFATGPFKTLDGSYHREHSYHGMRFSSAAYGYKNSLLPKSVPVDPQIFNQAVEILTLRWTAETLGKRVSDYPLLTADLIAEKINAADFGYTF